MAQEETHREDHHEHEHQHHEHEHKEEHRRIDYTVDGEPQHTDEAEMTPREILTKAGIDPAKHYLTEIRPHQEPLSFQNEPDKEIRIHEHEKFVSVMTGPTPVS